jgi:hypothetical protein
MSLDAFAPVLGIVVAPVGRHGPISAGGNFNLAA